jgi:hypothetical protein
MFLSYAIKLDWKSMLAAHLSECGVKVSPEQIVRIAEKPMLALNSVCVVLKGMRPRFVRASLVLEVMEIERELNRLEGMKSIFDLPIKYAEWMIESGCKIEDHAALRDLAPSRIEFDWVCAEFDIDHRVFYSLIDIASGLATKFFHPRLTKGGFFASQLKGALMLRDKAVALDQYAKGREDVAYWGIMHDMADICNA